MAINVAVAVYLLNDWLFVRPTTSLIPGTLIAENASVRSEIEELSKDSNGQPIAVALLSSKARVCVENKIATYFKRVMAEKPEIKLYILFSANTSDQDLLNFKNNFDLNFDVRRMTPDLDIFWDSVSQKYEAEGVIVLRDKNGLTASENLAEMSEMIEGY